MGFPEVVINLTKIEQNARTLVRIARPYGVEIVGVTKVCLGGPQVAGAMVAGGIKILADSRLENLEKLRRAFPQVPLMLLRLPGPSRIAETVSLADISLNSELSVLKELSAEAVRQGKQHRVILMVDMGDLREGIWPEQLADLVEDTGKLDGIILEGLGTNLACFGGVVPTVKNMNEMVTLAGGVEKALGVEFKVLSGGNSAALPLLMRGELPVRINQLRIGEGIMLGRETVSRTLLPGAAGDAFTLRAEVLERQEKPTVPRGVTAEDAFGHHPQFVDEGWKARGIVALGRQDVPVDGVIPRDCRVRIFGASSDHLIIDLSGAPDIKVGSVIEFDLTYGGLLGAMTSPYIEKRCI